MSDDRSSQCNARLMLMNANCPSRERSARRFWRASWGITLETKEELLLTMLFFGFRFFAASLASFGATGARAGLPSPNVGSPVGKEVEPASLLKTEPDSLTGLLGISSLILCGTPENVLLKVVVRKRLDDGGCIAAMAVNVHFEPAVGGSLVVARGLLLGGGMSDGCGGGVASWTSSRRTYVPDIP